MASKVNIELRPYDALIIMSFLREYFNDSNKNVPEFASMHETVDNYEQEIYSKISLDHLDDAILESDVNMITGRSPKNTKP